METETPRRIIAKIGTDALVNPDYTLKSYILENIAKDVSRLNKEDEIIIVTSGAVACGKRRRRLGGNGGIEMKQVHAAVGQPKLMQAYDEAFSKYGLEVGQLLLTKEDLFNPDRFREIEITYQNMRGLAVPIVNENDTICTTELFGDNDKLSLQLLRKFDFRTLINFTQRGALIKNGAPQKGSNHYNYQWYDNLGQSENGTGGLDSKLECAKEAVEAGKNYYIAKAGDSIFDVLSEASVSTRFYI